MRYVRDTNVVRYLSRVPTRLNRELPTPSALVRCADGTLKPDSLQMALQFVVVPRVSREHD